MLVRTKNSIEITGQPLDTDNNIYSIGIVRNGVTRAFTVANLIEISLFPFESPLDLVPIIATTATFEIVPDTDPNTGVIRVTAESGDVQTFQYTNTPDDYNTSLPQITSALFMDNMTVQNAKLLGIRKGAGNLNIIDIVVTDGGSLTTLVAQDATVTNLGINRANYDTTEERYLYNGVDEYWKIVKNSSGATDYEQFLYATVQNNSNLFGEDATVTTPVAQPYANLIGIWLHGVFIQWDDTIEDFIESIYTTIDASALQVIIDAQGWNSWMVPYTDIDTTFKPAELLQANIWNRNRDEGFTLEDRLVMGYKIAGYIRTLLENRSNDEFTAQGLTFTTILEEETARVTFLENWIKTKEIESLFDWLKWLESEKDDDTILGGAVTGTNKDNYLLGLRESAISQLTYSFMTLYLNRTDYDWIKRRIEWMIDLKEDNQYPISVELTDLNNIVNLLEGLIWNYEHRFNSTETPAAFQFNSRVDIFAENLESIKATL